MTRQLASLKKDRDDKERAELLATVPNMPSSMRRMLTTQDLDIVRQAVKDYLATETAPREAERAEIARRMGRGASPKGVTRDGRHQYFHPMSAAEARASGRNGR